MRRRALCALLGAGLTSGCLRSATGNSRSPSATSSQSDVTATTTAPTSSQTDTAASTERPPLEVQHRWTVPHSTSSAGIHHHFEESFIVGDPETDIARISYDGAIQWSQSYDIEPGEESYLATREVVSNDTILFGGRRNLYGVNTDTGEQRWLTPLQMQADSPQNITTELVAENGTAVCSMSYKTAAGDDRCELMGVDVATGQIEWTHTHDEIAQIDDSWLGVQSLSPPIDGRTIVGGWNVTFWLDIETGEIGDDAFAGARYQSIREGSTLYLTDYGRLFAFSIDGSTVSQQWEFEPLGRTTSPPTATAGTVYVAADDTGIYAVRNGDQQWRYQAGPNVRIAPAVTDNAVWAIGDSLHCIRKDGTAGVRVSAEYPQIPYTMSSNGGSVFISGTRRTMAYGLSSSS